MKNYAKGPFKIFKTDEYKAWFYKETLKSQAQIDQRLANILIYGHFGDYKSVEEHIFELRWKNGRRIYYAFFTDLNIILLIGGNKNGQDKDIKKAKNIIKKYFETHDEAEC